MDNIIVVFGQRERVVSLITSYILSTGDRYRINSHHGRYIKVMDENVTGLVIN